MDISFASDFGMAPLCSIVRYEIHLFASMKCWPVLGVFCYCFGGAGVDAASAGATGKLSRFFFDQSNRFETLRTEGFTG